MSIQRSSHSLIVAGEVFPLAKTGGLADAVGGLAQSLRHRGWPLHVLLPAYRGVLEQVAAQRTWPLNDLPGGPAHLVQGHCRENGLPCLLLDSPSLYARPGLYVDETGRDYADNAVRYAALAHAAAAVAAGLPQLSVPAIVHAHDWHAGLVPLLVKHAAPRTRTVLTIHNIAFQGSFECDVLDTLGLPRAVRHAKGLFAHQRLNFMQAGIAHADRVTTVSRTYAHEILQPEGSHGLHAALAARAADLIALPNGIDTSVWDPSIDPHLGNRPYDAESVARKAYWKADLQRQFGLQAHAGALLVVSCSRLTEQKMADVTLAGLPRALDKLPGLQFIVQGKGDARFEAGLKAVARRYPGRCAVRIGYDECIAHQLQAGADALWHPSRFEPFGLTPLYAMQYGTLPLATAVGGMADTIHDPGHQPSHKTLLRANGLLFDNAAPQAMIASLRRATALHENRKMWRAMQHNAMLGDHGWNHAVLGYLRLFAELRHTAIAGKPGQPNRRIPRAVESPTRPADTQNHTGNKAAWEVEQEPGLHASILTEN